MSGLIIEEYPTEDGKRIGHIRLNAERSLNALTLEMIEQMLPTLRAWQQEPQLVAVLLDGAGDRAFCAGGDVVSLYHAIRETGPADERGLTAIPELAARFFEQEYRLDYLLHTFGKPVLCWGGGIVMGGGLGLFSGSSQRIVTETSRLAMPEVTIALYPDVGGSWFINHFPPGLGEFIALTGCAINGNDAHWLGLGNRAIAVNKRGELLPALLAVTEWSKPEAAVNAVLRQLEVDSVEAFSDLPSPLRSHQPQIRSLLDKDSLADKVAAILGAECEDPWYHKTRQSLAAGSPLAIAVIAEQLRRSRHCSLAEVFRRELALSVQLCRFPEFAEGVRARLIDKDNRPDWTFGSLDEVDEALLAALFESPWPVNPLSDL
ncbi:enoyl-CoA hydratase/isomerase family protein [Oceanisphaera arctica]|uniref:3-hydroxyisobutyryl-CoA hydrolase n=1 Tax=Oceanisphaera arctica TaxID=641510 RepID=A0A2P5TM62_9GAMM|nr:enoyl-CoA hydratase/isomerase family protein [Oceanisphaera arctica]PPL16494.1 enoyl-CoA hydratase [Oceanisphaera arctica]GHA03966.1 enoyl-CoA hydratase [Oceanisphaera arctica]